MGRNLFAERRVGIRDLLAADLAVTGARQERRRPVRPPR